jgi:cytoskeletal protein CcmA (bactofilin family)
MDIINLIKMMFSQKGEHHTEPVKPEVTSSNRSDSSRSQVSRIHANSTIAGNIKSQDNLYFGGTLIGDIDSGNKLILGENADVRGNIYALNLIVLGKVEGDIHVSGKIVFGSKSNFHGKVSGASIELKNGAVFNASCTIVRSPDVIYEGVRVVPESTLMTDEKFLSGKSSERDFEMFFGIPQNQ